MLTPSEIQQHLERVLKLMRKSKNAIPFSKEANYEMPDYHTTYEYSVQMKEAIEIHAIHGKKPDKLIAERAPNQTDKEFDYALKNYQQTTIAVYIDFINTYQRAFADNNWSIDYRQGDDKENQMQRYLEVDLEKTPLKMGFYSYMFNVIPAIKTIDAMGCIAYKPHYIPSVDTPDGPVISGDTLFEPVPVYYPSESILSYQESQWYLFLTQEHSEVEVGGRKEMHGLVFEFYDQQNIWRIEQVGKKIDYTFSYTLYFKHDLGYTPVTRLKGIPFIHDGEMMFQSLFLYAVPNLNEAILDGVMLRSIKANCVFPFRVMTGNPCDHKMMIAEQEQCCNGTGWFHDFERNIQISCTACYGSGLKDRISPHGVLLLKPETNLQNGEMRNAQPAMYYVEPSMQTPQHLRSEIDRNEEKARAILHLRTTTSQIKGSPDLTATETFIDDKALISAVKIFSDQVWDIFEFSIDTMGRMRYGSAFERPVVNRSRTFDFTSESEYIEMLGVAIKNGAPPFAVYEILYRFLKAVFFDDAKRADMFELISRTDRLLAMPADEISLRLSRGLVAPWEVVLHDSPVNLVQNITKGDARFFSKTFDEQQELLIAEAQRVADEAKASTPTTGTNVVDAVLSAARNPAA